jgi:intracellular septation protein A
LQTSVHKQIERQLAIRLATLAGLLVLTARILLLLSWLLATALLLARLLSGILVLLAGILVLIGHRDLLF